MISRGFSKYKPISRKKKLLKECLLRYLTRSLTSLYPISLSWSLAATLGPVIHIQLLLEV